MAILALRADASHIDTIAPLFDAYRGFYGQPSNLPQSPNFIAERIARDETVIFFDEDTVGQALGFVQMFPTFSCIDAHRTWLQAQREYTESTSRLALGLVAVSKALGGAGELATKS